MNKAISNKEKKCIETMVKLMGQGNFESVIKHGENYIKEFPEQVFFHVGISLGHSESGNTDKAISVLEETDKIFPDNSEVLFQLGKMFEDKGEYPKAIDYFYKSYNATPVERRRARADCYNDIGAILADQGKEDEAVKLWREALIIDPANANVKFNLRNLENDDSENDTSELIKEEFSEFSFCQMHKYFVEKGITKFSSKKEEKNFRGHIESAFFNQIMPKMIEIEKMNEDEKIELYEDTEVDFDQPVEEIEMPKLEGEISEHLQNVFPYLPDDGIIMIMLVLPALEYTGITEEKFNNFIAQTETPDGRETGLLKWAYEIGVKVYEFSNISNSKIREKSFNEILELLNKELDENDTLTVIDSITDRISDDYDENF